MISANRFVHPAMLKTLDQVVEQARLLMAVDAHAAAISENTAQSELQELKNQISELTEQVAMFSRQRRPCLQLKPMVRCYNCGGIGHIQQDCPTRRRVHDGRRCFNCKRPGHLQRDCRPSWKREGGGCIRQQSPPLCVSIIVATVKTDAVVITGKVGEHTLELMLDLGSSLSLLRRESLTGMTGVRQLLKLPTVQLITAAGAPLTISDYVQVPVKIGNVEVV